MMLTTAIGFSLATWALFHLVFDFLLERHSFGERITKFCERNNIQVSFFQIRYFTTKLNRFLYKLSLFNVRTWFNAGVISSALLMVVSILFLIFNLQLAFGEFTTPKVSGQPSKQVLRMMVPGVNFPLNQVPFLFFAIFFSGFFHEIGHAVAALREGVPMNGLGFFLVWVYPGAFVNIDACDHIQARRRLRIFCAGVWHNLVLSAFSCVLIVCLPQLLCPFYQFHTDKVIVESQSKLSPLAVEMGIQDGDVITSVDGCNTNGLGKWYSCVNETIYNPQAGSCMSKLAISMLSHQQPSQSTQNCCENAPTKSICYKHAWKTSEQQQPLYSCMHARTVLTYQACYHQNNCKHDEVCVKPYQDDGRRLMHITVERNAEANVHSIIYLGLPHELYFFIKVTAYEPRTRWFSYTFPSSLLQQLQFFFSISTALGLLNIIPCYYLDGQYAFEAFFDEVFGGDHRYKKAICSTTLAAGSLLVAANLLSGFIQAFR